MKGYFKYNNKKTSVAGIIFDSKKEAEYYQQLRLMERAGKISNLELQKKFEIVPKKGNNPRARYYYADFVFQEDGKTVIVDVKSSITKKNPVYSLKKALMLYLYPDYTFREID